MNLRQQMLHSKSICDFLGFRACNTTEYIGRDCATIRIFSAHLPLLFTLITWCKIQTPNMKAKNTIKSPIYHIKIDHQCIAIKDSSMFCPRLFLTHVRLLLLLHYGDLIYVGCRGVSMYSFMSMLNGLLIEASLSDRQILYIQNLQHSKAFTKHMYGIFVLSASNKNLQPCTTMKNEWGQVACFPCKLAENFLI